jgi:hypothetical protein
MSDIVKQTEDLEPADFAAHPVWEYVDPDDTLVRPVEALPVDSLDGRIVGTQLTLHNGSAVWGVLACMNLRSMRSNEHFIALWVERRGRWFDLARYHDVDWERRSPAKLAEFLGLPLDEVFPISYDISAVARGLPETVRGQIRAEPRERLTQDELIELALETAGDEAG